STAPRTTQTYTLSLHDALPISRGNSRILWDTPRVKTKQQGFPLPASLLRRRFREKFSGLGKGSHPPMKCPIRLYEKTSCKMMEIDRKSTRLNSSHVKISYAVFC